MEKNAREVEKSNYFEILVFKIFCLFSQFLNEFELQVNQNGIAETIFLSTET